MRDLTGEAIAIALLSLAFAAFYVRTRWRSGDWSNSRDLAMLIWIAIPTAMVVFLFLGPQELIPIVLPLVLIVGGANGIASKRGWFVGWLPLLAGIGWFVMSAAQHRLL